MSTYAVMPLLSLGVTLVPFALGQTEAADEPSRTPPPRLEVSAERSPAPATMTFSAADAEAAGGVAGMGTGPRNCPPGSNYAQRPHQPSEPWLFISSEAAGRKLYENFDHDGRDITSLWFWGADFGVQDGAVVECDEPNPVFEVIFYPNNAVGDPDLANPICIYPTIERREKVFKDNYFLNPTTFIEAFRYKVNFDPVCQLPPGVYWVSIAAVNGDPDCFFFWLSSPEGLDGLHYDGSSEALEPPDLSLCINRPSGQPPNCPADIIRNKIVDVDDLVAVILNWNRCPAPCPPFCLGDINGDCLVDVDDLVGVILAWGPCPGPPNDECEDKIVIERLDPAGVQTVPFDMRGATPSPEPSQCLMLPENIHKDAWWCIFNLSNVPKIVTVRTTVDLFLEVTAGCQCPPGPIVACGPGLVGGVSFPLAPGQSVCLRLINNLDLPNEALKGVIEILNEPKLPCPNDECEDRIPVDVGSFTFETTGCSTNSADPPFRCGFNVGHDVWFNFTAPGNGILVLDTFGSQFDTVLKAYDGFGCPPSEDANLGCNDDAGGPIGQSELVLDVANGQEIKIRVGGSNGASGLGVLNIHFDEIIGPRECPPDSNYGQRPHQADEEWTFARSDKLTGDLRIEDFSHNGRAITRLAFWGADLRVNPLSGALEECNIENPFFNINFYLSVPGGPVPDLSNPVCTYHVRATDKIRKDRYGGLATAWYYTVDLDPPCPLPPGRHWVSIQGAGGGAGDPADCTFWWLSSPEMNMPGSLLLDPAGNLEPQDLDLSLCILGIDLPDPVNFYLDAGSFFEALTDTNKTEKFFWNFKPDFLSPGAVVPITDPLNIITHPMNAPGVWAGPLGNTWPADVDNVTFTSNPATPGGAGMAYAKAPAFNLDNNALFAEEPTLSFDIISGPPAGDNHTAFQLELVALGGDAKAAVLQVTVYDKNENIIGVIALTLTTPSKRFLGIITKDPALTIGRINIEDLQGGFEGISAIGAFAQGGPPLCPGDGDCCEPHNGQGCNNEDCCNRVCAIDPFCCNTAWGPNCVALASTLPQCECPPPDREIEFCLPPVCPPPSDPIWCIYEVKDLLGDPTECLEFGLQPGALICVSPCPFPDDPAPCRPNAPDPQVVFRVVGTNCRFLATSLDRCEPCPDGLSMWRRVN